MQNTLRKRRIKNEITDTQENIKKKNLKNRIQFTGDSETQNVSIPFRCSQVGSLLALCSWVYCDSI